MSAEHDPLDQRRTDIGNARFHVRHWRERLAIAMVGAAAAGMDAGEIEKRAGGELTLRKAEPIVRHI